jgi:hypothetical protein
MTSAGGASIEPYQARDYKSELKPIWCPACGDYGVVQAVYRALAAIGSLLGERTLPPASKRLETLGAHVIAWKTKDERQVLSRFDPWTGKDLWSRDFEDTAQVALIEYDEAAVLEISGGVTLELPAKFPVVAAHEELRVVLGRADDPAGQAGPASRRERRVLCLRHGAGANRRRANGSRSGCRRRRGAI